MSAVPVRGPRRPPPVTVPPLPPAARCRIRLNDEIVIPPGVVDLDSFRAWVRSDDFPRTGRFAFFNGVLWGDTTMEQAYTHNDVKAAFAGTLRLLAAQLGTGRYFTDGMPLSHPEVGFSTIPDGMFILFESLETGRIREVAGTDNGCVEFEGTPDMVLEVVSRYSEQKDEDFVSLYHRAGVAEYWVVDVRAEPLRFDVLKHGAKGYTAVRRQAGGWLKSALFGRSFRLAQAADRRGRPVFTLEVRP